MTTVNWVQDSNGNLEISSVHHLLQLMNRGGLYTDTGDAPVVTAAQNNPTDYWYLNYIQTVDIDLADHQANISPIGLHYFAFQGLYDGQEFRISNWAYSDPATDSANTIQYGGLFGTVESGGAVRNVRMDGVCTLDGFKGSSGMFAGNYHTTDPLYNIECNFSPGSYIKGGGGSVGGMIGWCQGSLVDGLTLRGTLDLSLIDTDRGVSTNPARIGGIIGATVDNDYYNIRNLATFPNGIVGSNYAGGIVGDNIRHDSFTKLMNYMKGDITGLLVGGIFGKCGALTGGTVQNAVNSMTGNLNGTSGCGGIIGQTSSTNLTVSDVANYMTGDITSTLGGGIVGHMSSVIPVTNSVNAMNGTVDNSVVGNTTSSTSSVYVDTSFGLVATGSDHSTTTLPTGWLTYSTFTDLPYFDVTSTDALGNIHNWDFVFGNLSGKPAYSSYTHLSLHVGNVSAPMYTVMDLVNTNTTTYHALANLDTETLFMDDSITHYESVAALVYDLAGIAIQTPTKSPMDLTAGADNINVVISEITGAVTYRLSIEEDGGSEVIVHDGITVLTQDITSLSFETLYTVRMYVDTGSGYTLVVGTSTTTLSESDMDERGYQSITVTKTGTSGFLVFSEMQVLTHSGENIALLGTATATTDNWGIPSNAINGDTSSTLFYHSDSGDTSATWTLTLDRTYYQSELEEITIYARSIAPQHIDGADVELVSDDGSPPLLVGSTTSSSTQTLSVPAPPMIPTTGADNINVVISEITGAVTYRLSIEEDGGSEVIVHDGITVLDQDITSLSFETLYTVRLYVDKGSGYILVVKSSRTTLSEPEVYKIVLSNDDYIHFTEFELYVGGTNIAPLGTATQTSTFGDAVASIGINGYNDGTVATGDTYNFCSTAAGTQEWALTLDKTYKRSELLNIKWYNRISDTRPWELARATGMTITLYYTGDITEQLGVLTEDAVQTFVITEKPMLLTPGVTTTKIDVTEIDGATEYRVDILETSTGTRVFRRYVSVINTTYTMTAQFLTQSTSYTANLFTDTGSGLELTDDGSFETLGNSASSYNVNDFGGSGQFDLSSLGSEGIGLIDEFMNDLFTTGDNIELKLNGTPTAKKSTFVNRGSTVSIDNAEALVAPFDESSGAGQEIIMTLSDNTTATVSYDENTNSVTVESNSYSPGDSFILDGKKVVVYDL